MADIDADYDVEETPSVPPQVNLVEQNSQGEAQSTAAGSSDQQNIVNLTSDDPPSDKRSEAEILDSMYRAEERATMLSGRLHLGMELEESKVMPAQDIARFTVEFGFHLGNVRKQAQALWDSLAKYGSCCSLIWHASWHLDFLSKVQAEPRQSESDIKLSRTKLGQLVTLSEPAWTDLKTNIPKNKAKQRTAWYFEGSRAAEYLRKEQERLRNKASDEGDAVEYLWKESRLLAVLALVFPLLLRPSPRTTVAPLERLRSAISGPDPHLAAFSYSSSSSERPQFLTWSPFTVKDGVEHTIKQRNSKVSPPWADTHQSGEPPKSNWAPWKKRITVAPQPPTIKPPACARPPLMKGPRGRVHISPAKAPTMKGPRLCPQLNVNTPAGCVPNPTGRGFIRVPLPPKGYMSFCPSTPSLCTTEDHYTRYDYKHSSGTPLRGGSPGSKRSHDSISIGQHSLVIDPPACSNPSCLLACLCHVLGKPATDASVDWPRAQIAKTPDYIDRSQQPIGNRSVAFWANQAGFSSVQSLVSSTFVKPLRKGFVLDLLLQTASPGCYPHACERRSQIQTYDMEEHHPSPPPQGVF
eukprot:2742952-Amphidinium_carterae.2